MFVCFIFLDSIYKWYHTVFVFLCLTYFTKHNGTPLQYACLENPMDRGAWWAAVHGVAKSWTQLSNFTFTLHFHALEKEMATHSSVLVWRVPGTGEPGGLPSMGSHRVGHDWSNLAAAAAAINLDPSTLLQMAVFHYFLWPSNFHVYLYITSSLSSCLMGTWVAFLSWLL